MVKENKSGKMARFMKVSGKKAKQAELESSTMPMETCMKESGARTRQMAKGHTVMRMGPSTLVDG